LGEREQKDIPFMTIFSLSTGLRSANAARITWPQIDLERRFA
jgi:hypothetical protein